MSSASNISIVDLPSRDNNPTNGKAVRIAVFENLTALIQGVWGSLNLQINYHMIAKECQKRLIILLLENESLFPVCSQSIYKGKKRESRFLRNSLKITNLILWTSQGLNLGPPDYESVALTN